MSELVAAPVRGTFNALEFCTFRVGEFLAAVDIRHVEEINRQLDLATVPHARRSVRGVINLRGEVVTVVDLRIILGLPPIEISKQTRNVVVNSRDEQIGLMVDSIGDVLTINADHIEPLPANFADADGRLFHGVYKLETELVLILDIDAALQTDLATR